MRKSMDSLYQEKIPKKLDEKILSRAHVLLTERQATRQKSKSHFFSSQASLAFAIALSLVLIIFSTHSLNNSSFSHNDIAEIEDSPLIAYSELSLDLMHDRDLIEQDLNLLTENEYELD